MEWEGKEGRKGENDEVTKFEEEEKRKRERTIADERVRRKGIRVEGGRKKW
jgi:hypothetical protein